MYGLNDLDPQIEKSARGMEIEARRPSVMENLQSQKQNLSRKLANVDAAIKALEANPGAADVLEALAKVNGY